MTKYNRKRLDDRFIYPLSFKLDEDTYRKLCDHLNKVEPNVSISQLMRRLVVELLENNNG